MSRFILPLCAACVIAPSLVSAFDEATDGNNSLKNATRKELIEKITSLELELAKLKSEQKQRSTQQQALTNWLTYTAPLTGQVSPGPTPLPPGIFALPSYPAPNADGSHDLSMPNANRAPLSDMPKGTKSGQFNGMTVYLVPCSTEAPATSASVRTTPGQTSPHGVGNHHYAKPSYRQQWSEIQRNLTEKPLPMKTSSAAPLSP